MGNTPNRNLPYPEDGDKLSSGDDAIKALAVAVDTELVKVVPVSQGGTGATNRTTAKAPLGFTSGPGDPPGGAQDLDVYFKIV